MKKQDNYYQNSLDELVRCSKSNFLEKIIRYPHRSIPKKLWSQYLNMVEVFKSPLKIKVRTFFGQEMTVIWGESVSMNLYRNGFYEQGLTRFLLDFLKPEMVFYDVGPHFGYFSLLASQIVGDYGQVHSFEPTPSTYRCCF